MPAREMQLVALEVKIGFTRTLLHLHGNTVPRGPELHIFFYVDIELGHSTPRSYHSIRLVGSEAYLYRNSQDQLGVR